MTSLPLSMGQHSARTRPAPLPTRLVAPGVRRGRLLLMRGEACPRRRSSGRRGRYGGALLLLLALGVGGLALAEVLGDDELGVHEVVEGLLGHLAGVGLLVAEGHEDALLLHELERLDGALLGGGVAGLGSVEEAVAEDDAGLGVGAVVVLEVVELGGEALAGPVLGDVVDLDAADGDGVVDPVVEEALLEVLVGPVAE